MAKLPIYNSKQNLTTQSPGVERNVSAAGQTGRNLQAVGKAVSTLSNQWLQSLSFMQQQTVLNNSEKAINEISSKAINDPNYNNSELYMQELDKVAQGELPGTSVGEILDNDMAMKTNSQIQNAIMSSKVQIQGLFRKKQVSHSIAQIAESENELLNNLRDTETVEDAEKLIKIFKSNLDGYRENNILSEDDVAKRKIKADSYMRERAMSRVYTNPVQTEQELKDGKYRSVLTPEETNDLHKLVDKQKKYVLEKALELEKKQEFNNIDSWYKSNPDADISDVVSAINNGSIPDGIGQAIIQSKYKSLISEVEEGEMFGIPEVVNNLLDKLSNPLVQLDNVMEEMKEQAMAGNINDNNFTSIMTFFSAVYDEAGKEIVARENSLGKKFKSAWGLVNSHIKDNLGPYLKNVIDGTVQGNGEKVARQIVADYYTSKYTSLSGQEDLPSIIKDKDDYKVLNTSSNRVPDKTIDTKQPNMVTVKDPKSGKSFPILETSLDEAKRISPGLVVVGEDSGE